MSLKINALLVALVTAVATLSPSLITSASARQWSTNATGLNCRIVGAVSHRCYAFHSDATWREGLADYSGSNGG
jgi:hypothetical protein